MIYPSSEGNSVRRWARRCRPKVCSRALLLTLEDSTVKRVFRREFFLHRTFCETIRYVNPPTRFVAVDQTFNESSPRQRGWGGRILLCINYSITLSRGPRFGAQLATRFTRSAWATTCLKCERNQTELRKNPLSMPAEQPSNFATTSKSIRISTQVKSLLAAFVTVEILDVLSRRYKRRSSPCTQSFRSFILRNFIPRITPNIVLCLWNRVSCA